MCSPSYSFKQKDAMSRHQLPVTPPRTPRKSLRIERRRGDDAADVSVEDFTEVLEDHITAYHVMRDNAEEGEKKKAILNRDAVRKFLNKAEIRFMGCSRVSPRIKQDSKRLISHR